MAHAEIHHYSTAGTTVASATVGTTAGRAYTTFSGWTTVNERSWGNDLAIGASAESIICGADGTGLYACMWDAQISHQTTGLNLRVAVCRNGSALPNFIRKVPMQASTEIRHSVGGNGLLRLNSANDALTIRVFQDATVASTANVWSADLSIVSITTESSAKSGVFA